MDLKKQDVAELFNVSLATVEKLVEEGKIPSYTLGGELRFSKDEIDTWMMHALSSFQELLPFGEDRAEPSAAQQFGLYRAIYHGGVFIDIPAPSKQAIIRTTMDKISEQLSFDPELVTELFLDREKLMPTALGHGVAIPHTREFLIQGLFDAVVVVYPEEPLDWGAFDGQPVHTLFFLCACDDKRHLSLLAKIAHLISSPEALAFLQTKPPKAELLDYLKQWEISLAPALC